MQVFFVFTSNLSMGPPPSKRLKKQDSCIATGQGIDFVTVSFSKELVLKVFSFLSLQDLVQCTAVSPHWSRISNDEMLWKPLFIRRFTDQPYRGDKKYMLYNKRQTSTSRYNGSWKKKYRIHHNWTLGNCLINDVVSNPISLSPNHLQFIHDIIFTADENIPQINVWKYEKETSSPHVIHQLQATEQSENTQITFMKLTGAEDHEKHLIAGYSNGGFTLWQVSATKFTEVAHYIPTVQFGKVVSIGMELPMIAVCTESGELVIFRIEMDKSCFKLVHQLKSPMNWFPVSIDIQRYPTSKIDSWKVVLCFGLSGGNYTTSVGIQEIILSLNSIVSSRHGFALNAEPMIVSSSSGGCSRSNSDKITAMTYSPPQLITAHANNTMKHYVVENVKGSLEILFKQTLYGHTFRVDALAIDASKRRLVSGDRSVMKIWDLSTQSGECQATLENYTDQSDMSELPDAKINTIGFDEDKIVAILTLSRGPLIRSWSFDS
ncbi:hypothetical protein BD408DRAFT_422154 [Parasitella parasitica]|nr:hypothetical protein BD408DRAFT_422154 [Parasitella parasitica]